MKPIVVVDLETTGLNNNPEMGEVDYIIEIGAVKIVAGVLWRAILPSCIVLFRCRTKS